MTECHVAELGTRWRASPLDHPKRDLLRQLEIAAAVSSELQDLEGLIGPPGYYGPLRGIASSPLPAPVVRVRRG